MGITRTGKMNDYTPPDGLSVLLHSLSLGAIAGVFLQILPVLAVLAPIVYYCFLIFETKTVSAWRKRRRERRRAHKLRVLRDKLKTWEDE